VNDDVFQLNVRNGTEIEMSTCSRKFEEFISVHLNYFHSSFPLTSLLRFLRKPTGLKGSVNAKFLPCFNLWASFVEHFAEKFQGKNRHGAFYFGFYESQTTGSHSSGVCVLQ
jgi:hypothetical protein